MATVLNVSEAVSIGLHASVCLAEIKRPATARQIAERLGVSGAHLHKVLGRMARAGLVEATPGPGGGFLLARPPARIALREVYEAISGPLQASRCLLGRRVCDGRCILGDLIGRMNRQVSDYLSKTTLADLAGAIRQRAPRRRVNASARSGPAAPRRAAQEARTP